MFNSFENEDASTDKSVILKSYPKGVQNKLLRLVNDILTNPRNMVTIGCPEELKHTDIEKWSRELTKKDRIVYSIEPGINHNMPNDNEIVIFHQYLGHYDDK
jgi:Txe/YoeB family toxin of Txe-Axe toxin-antitoxin module